MKDTAFRYRNKMISDLVSDKPFQLNNLGKVVKQNRIYITNRPEGRQDYQLIYTKSADGFHVIDGNKVFVKPESVILYRPHTPQHYTHSESGNGNSYWFHFTGSSIPALLESMNISGTLFDVKNSAVIENLFKEIYELCLSEELNFEASIFACTIRIFCELARLEKSHHHNPFNEIVRQINLNPENTRTNEEYAAACRMSKNYFVRRFTEVYGASPHAYILSKRLAKSKVMLEDTNMGIAEVAHLSGFPDSKYFHRFFRKHTGMTPAAYRRAALKTML